MFVRMRACLAVLSILFASAGPVYGRDPITVAVAANFARPLHEVKELYEQRTGTPVVVTVASSGGLAAQLGNGAPYDLFLSADLDRPAQLHTSNHCYEPFLYARGRVVFWSRKDTVRDMSSWQEAVRHTSMKRIAIANPKVAPYGAAVFSLLDEVLPQGARNRLIYGRNVAQTFQMAEAAIVDGAFTSMSFAVSPAGAEGRFWEVDEAEAVSQWGCINAATDNMEATEEFVQLLKSSAGQNIIRTYGYN